MLRAQRRDPAKAQAKCAFATNYPLTNRQLRSPLILRYRMQRDKPYFHIDVRLPMKFALPPALKVFDATPSTLRGIASTLNVFHCWVPPVAVSRATWTSQMSAGAKSKCGLVATGSGRSRNGWPTTRRCFCEGAGKACWWSFLGKHGKGCSNGKPSQHGGQAARKGSPRPSRRT